MPTSYGVGPTYQLSATSTTSTSQILKAPASAVLISVETIAARVTFDGTVPSSTNGLVFPVAVAPVLVPVGNGAKVSVIANAAGTSLVDITTLE